MLRVLFIICLTVFTNGCLEGKRPFLMVQLCLFDNEGVSLFLKEMESISEIEGMTFIDNSAQSLIHIKNLDYKANDIQEGGAIINIGFRQDDSLGVGASNIGVGSYQVVIGFSMGSNESEGHEFANRIISRLKSNWEIFTVPDGQGAMPLSCGV